jgi:hypothetical protein
VCDSRSTILQKEPCTFSESGSSPKRFVYKIPKSGRNPKKNPHIELSTASLLQRRSRRLNALVQRESRLLVALLHAATSRQPAPTPPRVLHRWSHIAWDVTKISIEPNQFKLSSPGDYFSWVRNASLILEAHGLEKFLKEDERNEEKSHGINGTKIGRKSCCGCSVQWRRL